MRVLGLIILLGFFQAIQAQEVLNNNAPSVKWQRIRTPNFRILYPRGFEFQAQRMANTLEHIREAESRTLGVSTRKISVILQNQTSVSNGFVSLIPRRSEWYTMPPQDYNTLNGTTDWLDALAAHEFRHVVQFDRSNTGFNRALYYLFGPATLAAMANVAVPSWFWEGDAVVTETAFTPGGRGRIPNFNLVFRTNLMEGRIFNYHKQYLRSYKHNIPNHYVLGYNMVSYLRERTKDPMIWEKVTGQAWKIPFIPFTFSNAIHKQTGFHVTDLYNLMAKELSSSWEEQASTLSLTPFTRINERNTTAYTDYMYPQLLSDGSVLTLKSGIGDISQFRILKNGEEKRSFVPGMLNESGILSVSGNLVVWNEYTYHPRWRMKSYSVIRMYDLENKRLKWVTGKTRFTGAALSPDQTKIATVESTTDYHSVLTVIDTSGIILKRFPNEEDAFYSMARWSPDGSEIISLKTTQRGKTIVSVKYQTGEEKEFLPYSNHNIGHPVLFRNYLFFNSPESGIDNIYVLNTSTGERLQVTSSKYGAYNPTITPDGTLIYYNEQSRDGMDVVSIPFDPASWKTYEVVKEPKSFYQVITEQEGRPHLFDSIPQTSYTSSNYNKISGIVNPYSWGVYFNTGLTQADIGISSQDILSTTEIKAGYLYDINERTGAWRLGVSYQNWFPIIDLNVQYAQRSVNEGDLVFLAIDTVQTTPTVLLDSSLFSQNIKFNWNEKTFEGGIRLPLITTNSRYHGNFTVANYVGVTEVTDFRNTVTNERTIPFVYRSGPNTELTPDFDNSPFYFFRDYVGNGTLVSNRFTLSAYRLLKQSRRDIYSKWGQSIFLNWYSTPYGGDYSGDQFSFYTTLYFPGLFKHHSLWGYWGYQGTELPIGSDVSDNLNNYIFRNQIPLPRGLTINRFQKFYSMSANYTLPVWYPDIALGPIVNFQRLRVNAFTDYGFGSSSSPEGSVSRTYLSVGGELRVDLNIFRLLNQFDIGFRFSYGIQPESVTTFEFLLGTINF